MLGLYIIPDLSDPMAVKRDPRWARLAAAGPVWRYQPRGGQIWVAGRDAPFDLAAYGPAITCDDGLIYHPPLALPSILDLGRESIPPAAAVSLRRVGTVQVPLGVGPVYGCGSRRGKPSSRYGQLLVELMERAMDPDLVWGATEQAMVESVIFEGFAQVYTVTRELWDELAIYDGDEVDAIIEAMQGLDPKASGGGAPTSPPSAPG